jgi:hypothetical protein
VIYRLSCHKDPARSLTLSRAAWMWLLHSASQAGWNPMGTITQEMLYGLSAGGMDEAGGTYTPAGRRLVMLEDALNLMDALERVFVDYDHPLSAYAGIYTTEWDDLLKGNPRPGIGSLLAVAELCRAGSFLIEGKHDEQKISL